jgi:tight adherence protein B
MTFAAAHATFWSSSEALVLIVGACALLVGLAAALAVGRKRDSARARVERFVAPATRDTTVEDEVAKRRAAASRDKWLQDLDRKLQIARIDKTSWQVIRLSAALTIGLAVVFGVLTHSPIGPVILLVAGPAAARVFIDVKLQRTRTNFGDQLPSHLQELAASMRSGRSMVAGIALMAEESAEPTQGEFRRVMADEELGMPLSEALTGVVARMKAPDMEQVSLVAELQSKTGGNMAEVLDRVADSVRERAELNREVRALTAQARISRTVVTGIPPAIVGIIAVINPSYLDPLLHTASGQALVVIAILLMALGSWVMGRIVRIET